MKNVQEALTRIIHSCRRAMRLSEIFASEITEGTVSNCFDDIHGDLEDALYFLCDEHTDTLPESIVDRLIRDESLSDEEVAEHLSALVKIK